MAEGMIAATGDPAWVNSILNHPSIRPWITDLGEGEIDVSDRMASKRVLVLRGEHGCFVVFKLDTGIYEVHTAILPSGRGDWAREFARAGARFMFCQTDCVEILTRVPVPHEAARKLSLDIGFTLEWTTLPETRFRERLVPVEVYALSLQSWAKTAPGMTMDGALFHDWLNEQVRLYSPTAKPHPTDPAHDRVVGVTLAMIQGGQVMKGIVWYNRWAVVSRHPFISVVATDPLKIQFDVGLLEMSDDGGIRYSPSSRRYGSGLPVPDLHAGTL